MAGSNGSVNNSGVKKASSARTMAYRNSGSVENQA